MPARIFHFKLSQQTFDKKKRYLLCFVMLKDRCIYIKKSYIVADEDEEDKWKKEEELMNNAAKTNEFL